MRPKRLSTRLGIAVGLMGVIVVLLIVAFTYFEIGRQLDIRARGSLSEKLNQIEHGLLESYSAKSEVILTPHILNDYVIGHDYLALIVRNAEHPGAPILSVGNEAAIKVFSNIAKYTSGYEEYFPPTGYAILGMSKVIRLADGNEVVVTLLLERESDAVLLKSYIKSTILSLPLILILVGGCGWWLVRHGLSPLYKFSAIAARISAHDLDHRIDFTTFPEELKNSAHAINFMLERLDRDIQQLLQFSDDLAHELRSPLNNILGKVQVTLSRARTPEIYKQALESCAEELDRISQVISQMLFIVSANSPTLSLTLASVNLREEVVKVVNLFLDEAQEKNISLEVVGDAHTKADSLMMQRAIYNLLSNAIRHSSSRSIISLELSENKDYAIIAVRNSGEGIAAEHMTRIFDRFYRVPSSRSRQLVGTGLGLSIVRAIMDLHEGMVTVASIPGESTVFTLFFPKDI